MSHNICSWQAGFNSDNMKKAIVGYHPEDRALKSVQEEARRYSSYVLDLIIYATRKGHVGQFLPKVTTISDLGKDVPVTKDDPLGINFDIAQFRGVETFNANTFCEHERKTVPTINEVYPADSSLVAGYSGHVPGEIHVVGRSFSASTFNALGIGTPWAMRHVRSSVDSIATYAAPSYWFSRPNPPESYNGGRNSDKSYCHERMSLKDV